MNDCFAQRRAVTSVPIAIVVAAAYADWKRQQPRAVRDWLAASDFEGRAGNYTLIPGEDRARPRVVVVSENPPDLWSLAALPSRLAPVTYYLETDVDPAAATALMVGWGLGCYRFDRYLSDATKKTARLVVPKGADRAEALRQIESTALVRDLINTPAEDLGPPELAGAARQLAKAYDAKLSVVSGRVLEDLFPAVHAVGRAAAKPPCLVDFKWGNKGHPKVTLVGKGVCFDTGGLNLKPGQGMKLMKKDMGGAAVTLGLARLIMDADLPVRLRVIVPAVENNISGNAYRPGDVLRTRKGVSVEIGNTDAEGRLVLADALALADEEAPDLLIDCATLTGAARVALGPDLPALFCDDANFAEDLMRAGLHVSDPMWRMPLWRPYRRMLNTPIADINNAGSGGFAGAITAALFLKTFVGKAKVWAHLDLYGWNDEDRPGRPKGGEAMAMRALFETIRRRFGAA